ncbi:PEP-CTERM sorting domain-containing protein [Denitrobaculum tricleocarpae]|uniref:PEP-CTERM sorting domain-containing protein n=1 Tax=Denitrobaculum tricleocarpae TaxID=2591009 RepID=A0A545T7R2_9PROT|nr:PEP-CTERM sorting domain-containing protein [Denitrobaculum tricleocarpae]TQV73259.1 PEP-CTERM sorting domain-containing protein [Denitrobaculum tricleocarpae]
MRRLKSLTAGLVLALCGFALSVGSAQAAPITFTNISDFVTAAGPAPITNEGFDTEIADGTSITFGNGVVSTLAGGQPSSSQNTVRSGFFQADLSSNASTGALNLIWTLPEPVTGVGLGFAFLGPLQLTIPELGLVVDVIDTLGDTAGFLGVIDSTAAFSQIQFSVPPGNTQSLMAVDNLLLVAAPAMAAVPEPGTLTLFGLGLAGFALARRHGRARGHRAG